jgi:hypothetical protein
MRKSGFLVPALSTLALVGSVPLAGAQSDDGEFVFEMLPRQALQQTGRTQEYMRGMKWTGRELPENERGIYSSLFRWPMGQEVINVCFIGGTAQQRQVVVDIASQWMKVEGARIPFKFHSDPSRANTCTGKVEFDHIRVGFEPNGTIWSALGKQSVVAPEKFPLAKPSMNFGFKQEMRPSRTVRRSILHEFGHALGLEHEHQNPNFECWPNEYNRAEVMKGLARDLNLDPTDIEAQMVVLNKPGDLVARGFDRSSIMFYAFPIAFYRKKMESPCFSAGLPEISKEDRELIADLYPADRAKAEVVRVKTAEVRDRRRQQALSEQARGLSRSVLGVEPEDFAGRYLKD